MVTSKQIISKRKKFNISQEELAKVIGVSRPTLSKIEKGERKMTKEEREKMEAYFEGLGGNEDYIRINIPQKNIEKFEQVLLYILEKVGAKPNVGMTVLYKLLYFIDFDYYEKYEEQLMGLTYFKNHHGPTPREFKEVVDRMKKEGKLIEVPKRFFDKEQIKFLPKIEADLSVLNGRELEMIDDVLKRYSDRTAKELSEMTHRDIPWQVVDFKENIDYEFAFYRTDEFSVREYGEL